MFFYIWGIGLIIIGLGVVLNNSEEIGGWASLIVGALMWIITFAYRRSTKCPSCGKAGAGKEIDSEVLDRSRAFKDKGSDGKYHTYEKRTVLITYRCRYCGEEWEVEEERKKQLSDD